MVAKDDYKDGCALDYIQSPMEDSEIEDLLEENPPHDEEEEERRKENAV